MPTYEYRCTQCGDFELEQRITEETLTTCPTCGSAVKKLMPRKLFVSFKGPGFHVNDYPTGTRKADLAQDTPPVSTDTKPAEKTGTPDKAAAAAAGAAVAAAAGPEKG